MNVIGVGGTTWPCKLRTDPQSRLEHSFTTSQSPKHKAPPFFAPDFKTLRGACVQGELCVLFVGEIKSLGFSEVSQPSRVQASLCTTQLSPRYAFLPNMGHFLSKTATSALKASLGGFLLTVTSSLGRKMKAPGGHCVWGGSCLAGKQTDGHSPSPRSHRALRVIRLEVLDCPWGQPMAGPRLEWGQIIKGRKTRLF